MRRYLTHVGILLCAATVWLWAADAAAQSRTGDEAALTVTADVGARKATFVVTALQPVKDLRVLVYGRGGVTGVTTTASAGIDLDAGKQVPVRANYRPPAHDGGTLAVFVEGRFGARKQGRAFSFPIDGTTPGNNRAPRNASTGLFQPLPEHGDD